MNSGAVATPCSAEQLVRLQGEVAQTWDALAANPQRDEFSARLAALDAAEVGQE